jgi:hypothetical protein
MTTPTELSTLQAVRIGVLGGFCLVLLKLMQAQFYVDEPTSRVAVVAYLTYLGFLVFSAIAGVYFAEHNVKKNTFIAGLLAPSILLTFFAAPNFRVESAVSESSKSIPRISWIPIGSAQAQGAQPTPKTDKYESLAIFKVVGKSDLEVSYKDAFFGALGRPVQSSKFAYIVGRTADRQKAFDTAAAVNAMYAGPSALPNTGIKAQVMKFQGTPDFFVSVGGLKTPSDAYQVQKVAVGKAFETLSATPDAKAKYVASLLVDGVVIDAKDLLQSK